MCCSILHGPALIRDLIVKAEKTAPDPVSAAHR